MATDSPGGNILKNLNLIYRSKITSEEVLKKLTSTCEKWGTLIRDTNLPQETAGIIFHLIATASNCQSQSLRQQLQQILQVIVASSLLTNAGAKLLLGMGTDKTHQYDCVLSDITTTVKTLFLVMPHSLLTPQTIGLIELLHKQIQISEQIQEREALLAEVSELKNDLMKTLTCKSKAIKIRKKTVDALEDTMITAREFRNISVMPEKNDLLYATQFLRKNKKVGKYRSLNDYLDVQFRLYREDCIAPLREAFEEFHFKAKENRTFQMESACIYRGVQVLKGTKISLDHGEVLEIALDKKHCSTIHWQNCKRLIFGSLLLLSFDNFKTTYFAIVADSDRDMLQQNECFTVNLFRTISNQRIPRETKGIILEATSAYYEAYRHVLGALKSIPDDIFPFEKYIVDCDRVIGPPKYLKNEIRYDLQPIISGDRIVLDHCNAIEIVQECRVPSWDTSHWPPCEDLHMDESQRQAFISALTKEFAIIQGPPGTGKTYIGVQIAKCLLHNSYQWKHRLELARAGRANARIKTPCLLVVCFTNHALDKFVEGIIDFLPREKDAFNKHYIPDVIRVGSQCLNPKVEKYSLRNIRKKVKRRSPAFGILKDAEDCKRNISMERAILKAIKSQNVVLEFPELFRYIEDKHVSSFGENPDDSWGDWLHISLRSWFEEVKKKERN